MFKGEDRNLNVVSQSHKNECQFYEMFHDVNDGFAPVAYFTDTGNEHRPGMIIMDDLSEKCITTGVFKTGTIQQFWNVARKIAHFQAIAACHNKDLSNFYNDFFVNTYHTKILGPLIGQTVEYDSSKWNKN